MPCGGEIGGGDLMNTQIGPATGHAPDASGKHQRTGGVAHGAAIRGYAEISGALAVIGPAVRHPGPTTGKLGLTDGDIELVLADYPAKLERRVDIAARGIDDDRQFATAELLQGTLEQRWRAGCDSAFGRDPFRTVGLAAGRVAAHDDEPHRRVIIGEYLRIGPSCRIGPSLRIGQCLPCLREDILRLRGEGGHRHCDRRRQPNQRAPPPCHTV